MTEEQVLSLADKFRSVCAKYDPDIQDLDALVEDTGGWGLCADVVAAFVKYARRRGKHVVTTFFHVSGHHAYPNAECYAFEDGSLQDGHIVAVIDGFGGRRCGRRSGVGRVGWSGTWEWRGWR